MTLPGDLSQPVAAEEAVAAPIDLVLGDAVAGGAELGPEHAGSLAALRARLQLDPLLAIEVAETRDLIERCRGLTVTPSPAFAGRLYDVVQRASLRAPRPQPVAWHALLGLAAALLTVALLVWLDPLRQPQRAQVATAWPGDKAWPVMQELSGAMPPVGSTPAAGAGMALPVQAERTLATLAFEAAVARMRTRLAAEGAAALQRELEAGLAAPVDPLQRWLDPQHALVELRLAHELRPRRELRQAALRAAGSLPVVDDRVQALADGLATAVLDVGLMHTSAADAPLDLASQALALRALLAAGLTCERREAALHVAFDALATALPRLAAEPLVTALTALAEYAAVRGDGVELVVRAGQQLLDEVLRPDDDIWARRLPILLGRRVPTALLADGGRMVRLLPAFGLPADRCQLLRRLWLGQLRERMLANQGPEPLAAALYGFADLLAPAELDELALELQRWQPARLVPDFDTVQHLVWGMEPGIPGHTRVQAGLRRLAAASDPVGVAARARLCLALACHYAARPLQAAAMTLGQ